MGQHVHDMLVRIARIRARMVNLTFFHQELWQTVKT